MTEFISTLSETTIMVLALVIWGSGFIAGFISVFLLTGNNDKNG